MKLQLLDVPLTVCRTPDGRSIDWSAPFTFAARTDTEFSLVCPTSAVPAEVLQREDGWRAFRFLGVLDFSLTGILAGIASVLAQTGVAIFALSTYDTDYVLVKEATLERALEALRASGYEIVSMESSIE